MAADHLYLLINETAVNVIWEDNDAVDALRSYAAQAPIIIHTSLYGGFEQVGSLPQAFPRQDVPITTRPGDIMLYSGDQLVVFFGENHWSYTPLGHIAGMTDEDLAMLLSGDTAVIEIQLK